MKKIFLWLLAFVITAAGAIYQRTTGPTYPMRGKVALSQGKVGFKLPRSAEITADCEVGVEVADPEVTGQLLFKRFKTADPWTETVMSRQDGRLVGYLPKQPMAGKLAYQVVLADREKEVSLGGDEPIVIRFKGHTPMPLLFAHVLIIFGAMLVSTRAGLAALDRRSDPKRLAVWTAILFFAGGFILGPLMQKFAFNAWWTGFPLGTDLTDSKTLFAMLAWVAALVAGRGGRQNRRWVLAASVVTLIVFLIPHSLLGSELKYTDTPR
ncbi:MAG TPA: hypothetical protein VMW46_05350 [Candidatus Desulfaltia sp.]|nr:hypothetical protein [Candidatus Desulfaltia sp.]